MVYLNKNEDTDALVLEIIDTKMKIKNTKNDAYRTHRIRKPKINGKPRPVIIKFVSYNDRKKVFSSKKLLKDSGWSITESFTAFRRRKLTNARDTFGFRNVWTVDRRLLYFENS